MYMNIYIYIFTSYNLCLSYQIFEMVNDHRLLWIDGIVQLWDLSEEKVVNFLNLKVNCYELKWSPFEEAILSMVLDTGDI
jgi:hypothetical protein